MKPSCSTPETLNIFSPLYLIKTGKETGMGEGGVRGTTVISQDPKNSDFSDDGLFYFPITCELFPHPLNFLK